MVARKTVSFSFLFSFFVLFLSCNDLGVYFLLSVIGMCILSDIIIVIIFIFFHFFSGDSAF